MSRDASGSSAELPARRETPGGWVAVAALTGIVIALYGRALGRYFTSEDFLLIPFLREHLPWQDLYRELTSPWLGTTVVKFYRPVSTSLFAVEVVLFGNGPWGYNLVHLAVHLFNAWLLYRVARHLESLRPSGLPWAPIAAALLFAVYPLHPNAVVFASSFATLFGSSWMLLTVLAYVAFRARGDARWYGAALGCFVLALGSYEAAAALPLVLVAGDGLASPDRDGARSFLRRAIVWMPFFVLTAFYLLLRRVIFGEALGGYSETAQSLRAPAWERMAHDFVESIVRMHLPTFERQPGAGALLLGVALLLLVPGLLHWTLRRRARTGRLWLLAWIWILAALAPFAFRPAVPGNGRYWYFAAAGLALSLTATAQAVAALGPRARHAARFGSLAVGGCWAYLLWGTVGRYLEAGALTRSIQQQLVAAREQHPEAGVLFVSGAPDFLRNAAQVPIAQVFHYGLAGSVQPPFARPGAPVYSLPQLSGGDLAAVRAGEPGARVFLWQPSTGSLWEETPPPLALELEALGPANGAVLSGDGLQVVGAKPVPSAVRYRLIVATALNANIVESAAPVTAGPVRIAWPREFLTAGQHLCGGPVYWWIEARGGAGELLAASRMRVLTLSGPPSRAGQT